MQDPGRAVHRTIVAVDVEKFGAPHRTLPHQHAIRHALYEVMQGAFADAEVPWDRCHVEDRGDGIFIVIPPEFPKSAIIEVVPGRLAHALRHHNGSSPAQQHVRLRMAVHAGEVLFDEQGVTSTSINHTFRFLEAAPLKAAPDNSSGVIALIVSRWIFDEVVRHSAVIDPGTFRPVTAEVKELSETAWIALPDNPFDADQNYLSSTVTASTGPKDTADRSTGTAGSTTSGDDSGRLVINGGVTGAGPGITIGAIAGGNVNFGHRPEHPH